MEYDYVPESVKKFWVLGFYLASNFAESMIALRKRLTRPFFYMFLSRREMTSRLELRSLAIC